jgi:hypothetical protein
MKNDLETIPPIDEKRFRSLFNTGVRRFPVGMDIECIVDSFSYTANSLTLTLRWGPYVTDRGLIIPPRRETITYSDEDELLTPYRLMKIIKNINPDAQFLSREDPHFYKLFGEELLNQPLLANTIEYKFKKEKPGWINKTKIIYLKNV